MDVVNSSGWPVIFRVGASANKRDQPVLVVQALSVCRIAHLLLRLLLPIILIVVVVIRSGSRGSIIFDHKRVGYDGRIFKSLKFRTMYVDAAYRVEGLLSADPTVAAEWALYRKLNRDLRLTPIGRWLRAANINELPQLVNVLRSNMSMVGPRPVTEDGLLRYGICARWYVNVYREITGPWQLKGRSGPSYGDRVEIDHQYAEGWSFRLDMAIVLRTPPAVFLRRGAQ